MLVYIFTLSSGNSLWHEDIGIRVLIVLALFLLLTPSLTLKELMSLPPFITKRKYVSMGNLKKREDRMFHYELAYHDHEDITVAFPRWPPHQGSDLIDS